MPEYFGEERQSGIEISVYFHLETPYAKSQYTNRYPCKFLFGVEKIRSDFNNSGEVWEDCWGRVKGGWKNNKNY